MLLGGAMAEYRLSERTRADLIDIYDFTESRFGKYQAEAYYAGLIRSFGRLADFPLIGQQVDELAVGYPRFRFPSHLIFYTMQRSIPALKQGVRINCISPGPTDTAMMPAFEEAMGKDFMNSFPKPIGRNARAEEQAYPLLFLNSDGASYIAGHNLMVDGGFLGGVMTGQVDVSALMPA